MSGGVGIWDELDTGGVVQQTSTRSRESSGPIITSMTATNARLLAIGHELRLVEEAIGPSLARTRVLLRKVTGRR